jgi:hypothetical protein
MSSFDCVDAPVFGVFSALDLSTRSGYRWLVRQGCDYSAQDKSKGSSIRDVKDVGGDQVCEEAQCPAKSNTQTRQKPRPTLLHAMSLIAAHDNFFQASLGHGNRRLTVILGDENPPTIILDTWDRQ